MTVETASKKITATIRDLLIVAAFLVSTLSNYYTFKQNQKENELRQSTVNAITDLKLQTMEIQVGKLEIELHEFQDKLNQKK